MKKRTNTILILMLVGLVSCHQGNDDEVNLVNMRMSNGETVSIFADDYVRLIDGDTDQVITNSKFKIKRRVNGNTLYLDVYQNGNLIGFRKHNQHVKSHTR